MSDATNNPPLKVRENLASWDVSQSKEAASQSLRVFNALNDAAKSEVRAALTQLNIGLWAYGNQSADRFTHKSLGAEEVITTAKKTLATLQQHRIEPLAEKMAEKLNNMEVLTTDTNIGPYVRKSFLTTACSQLRSYTTEAIRAFSDDEDDRAILTGPTIREVINKLSEEQKQDWREVKQLALEAEREQNADARKAKKEELLKKSATFMSRLKPEQQAVFEGAAHYSDLGDMRLEAAIMLGGALVAVTSTGLIAALAAGAALGTAVVAAQAVLDKALEDHEKIKKEKGMGGLKT
jgi:hypothetical protein